MTGLKKRAVSLSLAFVLMTGAAAPVSQSGLSSVFDTSVTAEAATAIAKAKFTDYDATPTSITLSWKKVSGAKGYRIYRTSGGKDTTVITIPKNVNTCTIEKLASGTRYSYKVRAYKKEADGTTVWGAKSDVINTVTAPIKTGFKITLVKGNAADTKVAVYWEKVKCTGYLLYLYDCHADSWVRVADITDPSTLSYTFSTAKKAPGGKVPLNYITYAEYGYQFAVRPYTKDKDGLHTFYSKTYKKDEPYYNIDALASCFGSEYELLCKILPKLKADTAPAYYYTYITTKDEKTGKISSTKTKSYVSDASKKAYDKFAKAHFGKTWTDEQKVLYTLNWINKNSAYDYEGKATSGYLANVLDKRLGMCNSYNGAIAEMLTYLGYKDVYLQCMTPKVRSSQHFRTELTYGKKTYSFEVGNMGKYEGWLWLFEEYDEVPLK